MKGGALRRARGSQVRRDSTAGRRPGARAPGCDGALGAAETALRAGPPKLGGTRSAGACPRTPASSWPRLPCGQGHEAEFTDYRDKVIDTVLGPVTLRRAWYHCSSMQASVRAARCRARRRGHVPVPRGLAAMNDIAAAAGPFAKAAALLEDLAGVSLTVKRVYRAAEASGAAQSAAVRERSAAIAGRKAVPMPPSPCPDMLYGAIYGTGVTMTAKETAGREGKGEDGRARTREVKLAVFFTQDDIDEALVNPVRDRDSPSYIATFEPASVFGDLVKAEGIRRGAGHATVQPTILGDGAAWIWGIAADKFPGATQIVDLFHAREHLNSLARSLEFMLLDRKDQWLAARLEDLDHGDIDGIEAAVRKYPLQGVKKDEAEKELGYFLNNAPRMRYRWFRSRGLFTGSGIVEVRLQGGHRPAPQNVRHALDHHRSRRHHHAPLPVSRPAVPKTASGSHVTTRQLPPDQPPQLNDLAHPRN